MIRKYSEPPQKNPKPCSGQNHLLRALVQNALATNKQEGPPTTNPENLTSSAIFRERALGYHYAENYRLR